MFARLLGLEYAHRGLRDDQAPLPVWLDLVLWDREYQTLGSYIESQWKLISYWKHWLQGNRAAFFLDNWNDLATATAGVCQRAKRMDKRGQTNTSLCCYPAIRLQAILHCPNCRPIRYLHSSR